MSSVRRLFAVTVASLAALAFQVGSADAATIYKLIHTFGALTAPTDVTVDQSNGNVYVTDSGANVVDVFNAEGESPAGGIVSPITGAGTPAAGFSFGNEVSAVAIDESGGASNRDLYVSDGKHAVVDKFALNAITHEYEYLCQLTGVGAGCVPHGGASTWIEPDGVAVDPSGNLYVASVAPGRGAVSEFDSAGADVRQFIGSASNEIREAVGVALAANGDIYVNNFHHSTVKLVPAGAASILDGNGSTAVAVDAQHEVVFVDDGSYIAVYNGGGTRLARFGEGTIGQHSEGVAVKSSSGDIYVSDCKVYSSTVRHCEAGTVEVFAPATVPDVTTGGVKAIGKATATVTGAVNPVGAGEATYFFQYGTSTAYGSSTPEISAGSGSGSVPVEASLTGLAPETTYHYRLVAKNTNGTNEEGEDRTFTIPPAVTFKPCPPINLRGTSGALCVLINPEGVETSFGFGYGLQEQESAFAYEHFTGFESAGSGGVEAQFTIPITALQPSTTYHHRFVAFNELGFTVGPDETFMTPPAEPTVNDQPPFATGISLHEATLHGTVNPGNGVTTYHFEYGTSAAYDKSTPPAYTQLNDEGDSVEQVIAGLQAGTVYHYRLIATNLSGTTTGPDETFTTLDGTPPTVETGSVSQISPNSATIAGTVDPVGEVASYDFEVGTSANYGTRLFGLLLNREEVSVGLSGLLPETVYHYRLVVSDAAGVVYGADHTFVTLGYPVMIGQPSTPALLPIPVFPKEGPIRLTCRKGFVKKGNRCVKKPHHPPVRKKHRRK